MRNRKVPNINWSVFEIMQYLHQYLPGEKGANFMGGDPLIKKWTLNGATARDLSGTCLRGWFFRLVSNWMGDARYNKLLHIMNYPQCQLMWGLNFFSTILDPYLNRLIANIKHHVMVTRWITLFTRCKYLILYLCSGLKYPSLSTKSNAHHHSIFFEMNNEMGIPTCRPWLKCARVSCSVGPPSTSSKILNNSCWRCVRDQPPAPHPAHLGSPTPRPL